MEEMNSGKDTREIDPYGSWSNEHFLSEKHCKCLQGIAGTLQGNRRAGISNLWGLHVYPQSL